MNGEPVRVTVSVECGHVGGDYVDVVEVDRAEWDAMSPIERQKYCTELAVDHMEQFVSSGWHIDDPDDYRSTAA
jgi:hypothetical protein